jgi:hypothetical protein
VGRMLRMCMPGVAIGTVVRMVSIWLGLGVVMRMIAVDHVRRDVMVEDARDDLDPDNTGEEETNQGP